MKESSQRSWETRRKEMIEMVEIVEVKQPFIGKDGGGLSILYD
jgi:hypothetical protein